MGEVIWGHDFTRNRPSDPIRTWDDAVDHVANELMKMLDEGDTLMVLPIVEPPADCPA